MCFVLAQVTLRERYYFWGSACRMTLEVTNSHGYVRNGTYDGLLGALASGVVDIGASATLFVPFRMMVVSFTGFNIPVQ